MSHNAYGHDRPSTDDKDDDVLGTGEDGSCYEGDEAWYVDGDGVVSDDLIREIVAKLTGQAADAVARGNAR